MNSALKIHPLMLAATIAFWGWQTSQWLAALAAGALVCTSFYVSLRWTLTDAQRYRVADFCTVLALLLGGWMWLTYGNPRAVILFFTWLPLMLLPVALMHAYSNNGGEERMNLAVLFWSVRRQRNRVPERPALFDPWFPYYALWIVAASAANQRGEWFYVGLIALVSWPLVRVRPWSYRVGSWAVAFSTAIVLGYGIFYALNETQTYLEGAVPDWISAAGSRTDPYRATTDIGHIGKLKDSDSIVLRVTTPDGREPPRLLHRASYNAYFDAKWLARGAEFSRLTTPTNRRWPLSSTQATQRVTIHDYTTKPNPVLSLPTGTVAIDKLDAIEAQRNVLGAVQITREPGYFAYDAEYGGAQAAAEAVEGPPTNADTTLSLKEREAFTALATELGLSPKRGDEAMAQVQQFFASGYRYSTYQKDALFTGSPIVDFLHRSKSGHCEYFATATVLLLRAGGIPARYATGFVAAEKSERENAWLVRTRHAHAWARAYVNGAWVDVDTTPASWLDIETAESAGVWSAITDWWSWAHFRASQAWANSNDQQMLIAALVVVLPFALWLLWRLVRSRRRPEKIQQKQTLTSDFRIGADSEFYQVEQRLAEQGLGRRAYETASDWLLRLKADSKLDTTELAQIVGLHYRYRFDPDGLNDPQRLHLKDAALHWLARDTPTPLSQPR